MQGVNQTTSAPNAIASTCRLETISRAGSPNVMPNDAMLKIWPVVVMITALTTCLSGAAPVTCDMKQKRNRGIHCRQLVGHAGPHFTTPGLTYMVGQATRHSLTAIP